MADSCVCPSKERSHEQSSGLVSVTVKLMGPLAILLPPLQIIYLPQGKESLHYNLCVFTCGP